MKPFQVKVPDAELNRLMRRVRETRFPAALEMGAAGDAWRYGANWKYMRELVDYWATKYDWRKAEAALNRYPQFTAQVDGYDIHFYHVKGAGSRTTGGSTLPLLLAHGWPGSVLEFQAMIPLLTAAGNPAYDLVIPSLPGFGFSSKPTKPIGPRTVAALLHKLMTEVLGYSKYGAQGGDWGNAVAVDLAALYPESIIGIHLNNTSTNSPLPEPEQNAEEKAWVQANTVFRATEMDYFNMQNHKPMTVSFALADNPVGWLAWMVEKLKTWTDSGDHIEKALTKDQILTNAMIYLLTGSEATGLWIYRGNTDDGPNPVRGKITVPTAFASFPAEAVLLNPPRRFLERAFNLIQYNKMAKGGHFAALEQPELLAADVRGFFGRMYK
jgi:pimeloyl-ACP methyl ester carboxylesterase